MKTEPLTLRRKLALEIARHIENKRVKEHPLRQLFWECTLRCNLNCRHCGSDCKKTAHTPDMPKEDFLRVLDSVAAKTDPHKVFVVVTGGEPLMRNDLEECGRAIYERGFPWGMRPTDSSSPANGWMPSWQPDCIPPPSASTDLPPTTTGCEAIRTASTAP